MFLFQALIKSSPPLAAAVALKSKFGECDKNLSSSNTLTFPVVEVATFMGWDSKQVKRELKNLEWDNSRGFYRKSGAPFFLHHFSNILALIFLVSFLHSTDTLTFGCNS